MQAWLLSGAWPGFWRWVLLATVGAAAAAAWNRRAVALVLVFAYVFPLLIRIVHGRYHAYFALLWLAPLLGAMLPQALRTPWQVPLRWRLWLAAWSWTIAAAAIVVMLRESDFYPMLAINEHVAGPSFAAQWILNVSLILIVGILWFDWLCGAGDFDARAWIAMPLAVSCAGLSAVAIYQGLVDINFYNESLFGIMGRATGTTFDGNVSAMIAAFWVGGALWIGERAGRVRWRLVLPAMLVAWLAVWATASRTGFAVAAIATVCVAFAAWAQAGGDRPSWSWRTGLVAAVLLVAAAGAFFALASTESGPLRRMSGMLPSLSRESLVAFATELWNRNRYGEIATVFVAQHPWVGIGIGSFYSFGADFGASRLHLALVPDNAQNWYRHQFVEFGLFGSLPWIIWTLAFAWSAIRRRAGEPPTRLVARGVLLAFGLVSLLGVPGQDAGVALTFWTFASWYVSLAPHPMVPAKVGGLEWSAGIVLLLLFVAGTTYVGLTQLRPLFWSRDYGGGGYAYGFTPPEPDGQGGIVRRVRHRAVTVVEVSKPWLKFRVTGDPRYLTQHAVRLRVWVDDAPALNVLLRSGRPIEEFVHLGPGVTHVAIESTVAYTPGDRWRDWILASRGAGREDASGSATIGWTFVDQPD